MKKLIATFALLTSAAFTQTFTLKSSELGGQFTDKQYYKGMGYSGENKSPQLSWDNAPKGTKSFAVTMYDLDAPTGSGFWHWVVFNLPADVHELKSGAGDLNKKLISSEAVQSNTDFGVAGYNGAAPNAGLAKASLIVYGQNL